MAERFASVSEDELCRLIEGKDSKNTKRATKASVKVFNEYLQEKNLDEPHHDDKGTLANVLKRFYAEARKKSDRSPYSKSSMTSLRFGLNRHFKTKGTDIIQDLVFAEANKVFLAKCVDLKRQGLHTCQLSRFSPSFSSNLPVSRLEHQISRTFKHFCALV